MRKSYPRNKRKWLAVVLITLACVAMPIFGQSYSNTVGYCKVGAYDSGGKYLGALASSDTLVSIPFNRPPEFSGTIQSILNNTVTVSGSPGWTNGQYVYAKGVQPKTYYALIGANPGGAANPKEGSIYEVTANTGNALTLDLNGDNIASVPANSQITLIPYWTLAAIFPAANAGLSFTASASTRSLQTEILIPNYGAAGTNLGYAQTYYFINNGANTGWRLYGDAVTTDHGDDPLLPNSYFVVRNANGAPTLPLVFAGGVLPGKLTTPEVTLTAQAQDNDVAMVRPIGVTLNNTGLNPSVGSFSSTTSTRNIQDQLFIYNNSEVGYNKSPSATYYYVNNGSNIGWRLFGDSITTDHGGDIVPAGAALTIRKAASRTGSSNFWQNAPTY